MIEAGRCQWGGGGRGGDRGGRGSDMIRQRWGRYGRSADSPMGGVWRSRGGSVAGVGGTSRGLGPDWSLYYGTSVFIVLSSFLIV